MTDDFVTRLGVALRDAADREERRRVPWRALATARTTLPRLRPSPVLATLIAGLVLAAAVYGLASLRTGDKVPAGPKIVAKLSPAGGLDQVVAGFGSVWLEDSDSQTLLRMDPATRRVTARIPLGGAIEMAPGRGVLWVGLWRNGTTSLLRIDPKTNKVAGRLDLGAVPGGWGPGGVPVMVNGHLWVLSVEAATRVDPATGRAAKPIVTARNGYRTRSFAVADGDLWVQTSDGRLVRLDGATGRRKAAFHVPDGSVIADLWSNGLYVIDETTLARVHPNDLRPVWRAPIVSIGPAIAAGGKLWVETPDAQGDRVLTVDPRTGHVIDSVHVGEFGAQWMTRVGSQVWMTTAGGHVVILGS
jgi:DNA-binding beta-propeller fold protein YncE